MTRTDTKGRLQRLELIAAQLKQGEPSTVADLAAQHGVSLRTISRDLQLMRDQGMPIDADRGRGGGVRLDRHWGVGRVNLSYEDAVDLLISIEVAERMGSPLFLANLGAVRRQLVASFSSNKRARIDRLRQRILIGNTASTYVQAGTEKPPTRVTQTLHRAFLDQETMQVHYRREDGQASFRTIEPHYLLLQYPVWYVVAWDHLRDGPRMFRCDRIASAERTGDRFSLLPRSRFASEVLDAAMRLPVNS